MFIEQQDNALFQFSENNFIYFLMHFLTFIAVEFTKQADKAGLRHLLKFSKFLVMRFGG